MQSAAPGASQGGIRGWVNELKFVLGGENSQRSNIFGEIDPYYTTKPSWIFLPLEPPLYFSSGQKLILELNDPKSLFFLQVGDMDPF